MIARSVGIEETRNATNVESGVRLPHGTLMNKKEKVSGTGRFGIKIEYDDVINIQWFETEEKRNQAYIDRVNTKARRIASGVGNHTITKIKRLFG